MITIYINKIAFQLKQHSKLLDALSLHGYSRTHFAIAVNRTFISKIKYNDYILKEGDHIEMITPMQGG
jgi:thiamine biosynthesis protein ThiS